MNIRTKQISIERSARFEEPLQKVELVEEKFAEIPSCYADHLGDESGSEGSDFAEMRSDISEKNISGLESYYQVKTHLQTWAKNTLSSVGPNIGNLADPRRTRSDFQREGIDISCHDSFILKKFCF